jgi:hydroxymethylpyrimidine kinase/phosphomethylpyrimidine kinase
MIPNVLSIAGSDPSGGAGIQADLKTFSALGCYGMAVLTALTAQNTSRVFAVHTPPPEFVAQQIDAIFADVKVAAVKIGMLGTGAIAEAVADRLTRHKPPFVVLDPVLAATSGDSLGTPDLVAVIRDKLLPQVTLITPNLAEAAQLTARAMAQDIDGMADQARRLATSGANAVLVKGGHLPGPEACDLLVDGAGEHLFRAARVTTKNTHGTGCTLSAAIAAFLAQAHPLTEAIRMAKDYQSGALRESGALHVGHGRIGSIGHSDSEHGDVSSTPLRWCLA